MPGSGQGADRRLASSYLIDLEADGEVAHRLRKVSFLIAARRGGSGAGAIPSNSLARFTRLVPSPAIPSESNPSVRAFPAPP